MIAWAAVAFAGPSGGVDLNRASASELDELPGLGPVKAQAIVEWRAASGGCRTLDDLLVVPGIGAATVEMVRGRGYCGAGEAASGSSVAVRTAPIARPVQIDPNTASVGELRGLPGITESIARAIVAERERARFTSCADLGRVPGIGPATIVNLASSCRVGGG
ncbi:MAG: helix-hairpin-helix domain-containing protein [Myxococcota bacterium]